MSIDVYGIPGCDTVKKARRWLDERAIRYRFHDYKKKGADPDRLQAWAGAEGWESLLNRRGTTFRRLAEADKADLDADRAVRLMEAHPSTIKRPVVEYPGGLLIGFDEDKWREALA